MHGSWLLVIIALYFSLLMVIARRTSRRSSDNTFFDGNRESPWYLVAFGMIGSGISAVSLVSIPGNVGNDKLYYFQFILGTIAGYLFIAFILLPVFYSLKLVSLYQYLQVRFGPVTYKTGAVFFMVSQSFGAALRLLLSVHILQASFFDALHIPFAATVVLVLTMIWLYTHQSGVKTIVWTDALQSFFLVTVILVSIFTIQRALGIGLGGLVQAFQQSPLTRWWNTDWHSGSHVLKQFISGFLITVALVGLDQSMMQKTLTVSNARDARKNVLSFSLFIAMAQTLFLVLGVLMYLYAEQKGIALPKEGDKYIRTDELYPMLTMHYFGTVGTVAFFIAVIASTFASIDSCITALTTSFSYDIMHFEHRSHEEKIRIKRWVLLGVNIVMFIIVMMFRNSGGAIIFTIFKIAGYTYGPLLGIYLLGFFSKVKFKERWVPLMCVIAPILTYGWNEWLVRAMNFDLGFMNILVNALLTIILLLCIQRKDDGVPVHH